MQYWLKRHWPDQAPFKHSLSTNCISNSEILHKNYISLQSDLCACVHVKKKLASQRKPQFFSEQFESQVYFRIGDKLCNTIQPARHLAQIIYWQLWEQMQGHCKCLAGCPMQLLVSNMKVNLSWPLPPQLVRNHAVTIVPNRVNSWDILLPQVCGHLRWICLRCRG